MKFAATALLSALSLGVANAAAIDTRSSDSWAGSNLYLLHGLSASDQAKYIDTLAGWGAKVIRIWVTGLGTGCQKGFNVASNINDLEQNGIGQYDDGVLEALDNVLAQFVQKGIKAIISPHDGNAFGYNSCDAYCSTYGDGSGGDQAADGFYTSDQAKEQYDARMAHILNYVSPSSGQAWGQWSDAILAFDVQNEPFQQAEDQAGNNDPSDWLCGRAGNMRKVMGDSAVKLATGGVGGDQSHGNNFMPKAVECSAIDIMSIHGYVGTADFWSSFLPQNLGTTQDNNKLLMVEEWGVETSYQDGFDAQAAAITAQGIPFTYWQFTFYDATDCGGDCCSGGWDNFEVGFSSSKGNIQNALSSADSASSAQDWSSVISS